MIQLTNGATVHAAYIVPAGPSMKPRGAVLAETETDWVVWTIYWDGDIHIDHDGDGRHHEVWECEQGTYIGKSMARNPEGGDPHRLAELSFGRKVHFFTTAGIHEGMTQ